MAHVRPITTPGRLTLLLLFSLFLALPASAQTRFNYRAVHLVEGTAAIDLHFQDRDVASVTDVPFETVSEQLKNLTAPGDAFNVKYVAAGGGLAGLLVEADIEVEANREYVGVAYGTTGSPKMAVLERNRAQFPQPGKVLFRVLNATDGNAAFDVYVDEVGSTPTQGSVTTDMVSPFTPVSDISTSITVTTAGSKLPIITVTAPFAQSSPFSTLIITGSAPNNLKLYVLSLSAPPDETGSLILLDEASYTDVRVVNLRPGVGDNPRSYHDIYLNKTSAGDLKVADTVAYRTTSRNFGPLIADSLRLKFVTSGEASSQPLIDLTRSFNNDTAYVVALTQFKDLRPTLITLGRTPVDPLPPGPGVTLARFVNGTDFYGSISAEVIAGDDTIRTGPLAFKESTEFESIPSGQPFSVRLFVAGTPEPIYDRPAEINVVPGGAFLTLFAVGTDEKLSVDLLNESLPGRRNLVTFDADRDGGVAVVRKGSLAMSVAPNPLVDLGRVTVNLDRPGLTELLLVDAAGRLVASTDGVTLESGEQVIGFSTTSVPAGSYTMILRIDGEARGSAGVVVVR